MTYVRLLTEEQKNQLVNREYSPGIFFSPILDADDNWIISNYESENCINTVVSWVKDLPLIEFNLKIEEEL